MATYLLDTGVLLGYVRSAPWAAYIEKKYAPSKAPNLATISIVSQGEIYALALRRTWGSAKLTALATLLRTIPATIVRQSSILHKYAEIDAYNHCKHPTMPPPASGHTMGDNDIWIAATASVLKATLLTTDHDFNHLHDVFLNVTFIDQSLSAADA